MKNIKAGLPLQFFRKALIYYLQKNLFYKNTFVLDDHKKPRFGVLLKLWNRNFLLSAKSRQSLKMVHFHLSTEVTIIPSAETASGSPKGSTLTFQLNAYEAVQILANQKPYLDLTGSVVRSNKPIVVYGGHARAETPVGFIYTDLQGEHSGSRDHMSEAMPPLNTWGYSFLVKNFGRDSGDILRVLAHAPNTIVKINGKVWGKPLAANEFRDTILDQDNSVALNNIAAVETDKDHTILVGMIAHTAVTGINGDPFLAIVPPLDQTYTDFTYFITTNGGYDPSQQFLIISTEQSGAGHILLDGNTLPAALYTSVPYDLNGGKRYAITTLNQADGIHHIVSSGLAEQGFTILAYGWGEKISYGYTAGALLKPHVGIMSLNTPTHSVAPGPGDPAPTLPPPGITIRNILTEKVYFDKSEITYSQNKQNIPVRLKKDIVFQTGSIEMAEEKNLELITSEPVKEPIIGNVRVWYHSRLWFDMWPVDFPFVITPAQQADVKSSTEQTALTLPLKKLQFVYHYLPVLQLV